MLGRKDIRKKVLREVELHTLISVFKLILLGFFLILSLTSHAQIYQWQDQQGVRHFADKPHQGAKIIELNSDKFINTNKNPLAVSISNKEHYQSLQITEPANQASIYNNQGVVKVTLSVKPKLQKYDQFAVRLDKKNIFKTKQSKFELQTIDRGEHCLQVEVIDRAGNILKESSPVIFYLHQTIMN